MVKPTEVTGVAPGTFERTPNAGEYVAEALQAEGVEYIFGITGGHMWPWLDPIVRSGIKMIACRNEMNAGHAAEAYARASGKIGVAVGTAGPGGTNMYSAIHTANLSNTPVLALIAGHEVSHDGMAALQECYTEKLYAPTTKLSKRLLKNGSYKFWIRKAVDVSTRYPKGPSVLEFELEAVLGTPEKSGYYKENWLKQPMAEVIADSKTIEKAVELIYAAEKPVIFAGDGVLWSNASQELIEFVEIAQIPVLCRRGGRGAVPEDHPLSFKTAGIIDQSDMFLMIGARLDFFDNWGDRWKVTKTIQVNDNPDNIHPWMETEMAIPVSAKVFLRQMIDYVKANNIKPNSNSGNWAATVKEIEDKRKEKLASNAERFKDRAPIHGLYMGKVIAETLEELYKSQVYVVMDSFTGSNMLSQFVVGKFAGQFLDAGAQGCVGHGIGYAIGAAIGSKKPVLAMMGDGGFGLAGLDVETAARYNLPIVYVVYNNDIMLSNSDFVYGKKGEYYNEQELKYKSYNFSEDIRYDRMFEETGCHGEWVQKPEDIRPALQRAFAAAEKGKPAVVNIDVSTEPLQSLMDSGLVAVMTSHIPWSSCTNLMKKHRRKYLNWFPWDEHNIEIEPYDRYEREPDDYDVNG